MIHDGTGHQAYVLVGSRATKREEPNIMPLLTDNDYDLNLQIGLIPGPSVSRRTYLTTLPK